MTPATPSMRASGHLSRNILPLFFVLVVLGLTVTACHGPRRPLAALQPVPQLDLNRYQGTWYEIASIPNPFQRNCFDTKATYTPQEDGTVEVRNNCYKGSVLGPLKEVVGKAWRPNAAVQGALKVQFFWPFKGDYWVLALDEHYRWALVGQPSRKYLWVLARTPYLEPKTYEAILAKLPALGYDGADLHRTVHTAWVTPAP